MRIQYDHSHQEVGTRTAASPLRSALGRSLIILLLFGCPAHLLVAGATDRDSDIATKVRSLEGLRFGAQKERNVAALDTLFDDGLMWVDANGVLSTKAGYMERLHQAGSSEIRIQSMTIKVFDQMAIVVGTYDESGLRNNRTYHQRCRFIDTWTLKRDRWVLIAATATATIS